MKKNTLRIIACAVVGVGSLVAQQTSTAATYTWTGGGGANVNWNAPANWGTVSTYPSAPGDVANLNIDFAAAVTLSMYSGSPTCGILNWGDSTQTGGVYQAVGVSGTNGGGTITFNNNGSGAQINHVASGAATDNMRCNVILQDNLTINVASSSYNIKLWGAITESGGSYGITKTGPGYLSIEPAGGASNWTGLTTLNAGRIQVASNAGNNGITGNILVNGGRLQNSSSDAIADTANIEFEGGDWNMGGPGNNETIASLSGAATTPDIFSGATVPAGVVGTLTLAATTGTTSYAGTFGVNNALALSKTGGSTQTLAGTRANVLSSVSVTGGTLELNKTAGVNALSGPITVGNGAGAGTIRLLASNQMADGSAFTCNGGTLDTNGFSETLSTLTNSGASTIDMGAGASILTFANSSGQTWSGSIQILNWSGLTAGGGTDQLLFGAGGLSTGQLAMVSFVNPTNYAPGTYGATILPSGEVVAAVPEPAIIGTLAASGLLALRRRRTRA